MKNCKFAVMIASACFGLAAFNVHAQNILPLGDSVTSSFAPFSSYRYWLDHDLHDAGFNDWQYVGTRQGVDGGTPDKTDYDQHHEGHEGWTANDGDFAIDGILNSIPTPDIVLLDLGSNDVEQGDIPLSDTEAHLESIIDKIRARNANVVILIAQPTPYVGPNSKGMSKLKGAVKKVAKAENQAGSPVRVVNLFGGFNARKDTFDGMHPNEKGEQKIAKDYFKALKKVLSGK